MSEKGKPKRFCRFCGSELKEGARFCTACGKKVAEDTAEKQKKVQKVPETVPKQPIQPQKSKGAMIYARHGRLFLDEELQKYFDAKPWYHGTIQPDDFQDTMLNDYEMKNKDLIVQYESEHFNN